MKKVTTKIQDRNGYTRTIRAYLEDKTWEILSTLADEERHQYIVDEHFGVYLNNRRETERHISLDGCVASGHDFEDVLFDIDESIEKEILDTKLHEIIVTLSPRKQKIIHLYFFENKTMEQIAQELGVQKPAISKQISRVLENLKELLTS